MGNGVAPSTSVDREHRVPTSKRLFGVLYSLFVHLRLHYQLLFLSPLFIWGFMLAGGELSEQAIGGFITFHVFLYGGITAYNSYYDRDVGPIGGLRRPPPVNELLLPFSLGVQGIGFVLALRVGWWFSALYAVVPSPIRTRACVGRRRQSCRSWSWPWARARWGSSVAGCAVHRHHHRCSVSTRSWAWRLRA